MIVFFLYVYIVFSKLTLIQNTLKIAPTDVCSLHGYMNANITVKNLPEVIQLLQSRGIESAFVLSVSNANFGYRFDQTGTISVSTNNQPDYVICDTLPALQVNNPVIFVPNLTKAPSSNPNPADGSGAAKGRNEGDAAAAAAVPARKQIAFTLNNPATSNDTGTIVSVGAASAAKLYGRRNKNKSSVKFLNEEDIKYLKQLSQLENMKKSCGSTNLKNNNKRMVYYNSDASMKIKKPKSNSIIPINIKLRGIEKKINIFDSTYLEPDDKKSLFNRGLICDGCHKKSCDLKEY